MKVIKFLHKQSDSFAFLFITLGLVSGLAGAGILQLLDQVITSYGAQQSDAYVIDQTYLIVYLSVLVLLILSQRIFSTYLIKLSQNLVTRIRLDILSKIRNTNYRAFEEIGEERIYASLTRDATVVSNTAGVLVYAVTSFVTVLCCLGYLAWHSMVGFGLTALTIGVGIAVYWARQKLISKDLQKARELETHFFKHIKELLSGFKEAKVNQAINDDLYCNYIEKVSTDSRDFNIKSFVRYLDNSLLSSIFFWLLVGVVIFLFPFYEDGENLVVSFIFILLYINGPVAGIMNVIPSLTQGNISMKHIEELYELTHFTGEADDATGQPPTAFKSLELSDVYFEYESDDAFSIGPINLKVNQGEIIFVVGGNGSGKSTFFKILTGLYHSQEGEVLLNGHSIDKIGDYRRIFAPVYSDYFLFDRFYGTETVDVDKLNQLIKKMELAHKVTYKDGYFSATSLSSGQRKRLALIVCMMAEKPVIVLDEWAADQDPQFRKYFYTELLPELKANGTTIIAITHDDHYFNVADRVFKMDYGTFTQVN